MRWLVLLALPIVGACSGVEESGEVVEEWIHSAFRGAVEEAEDLIDPEVIWLGQGLAVGVWVEGAGPFQSYDILVSCDDGGDVTCLISWRDLWIDGLADIDAGELVLEAAVEDGQIRELSQFEFSSDLRTAFNQHLMWLEVFETESFVEACADNPLGSSCSELLVATVDDWQESRR